MIKAAPFKEIKTEDQGVKCIFGDGKLVGIIHLDQQTHIKRLYSVTDMPVDEIAGMMEKSSGTPIPVHSA